jgi:hemin uptake protein HemP
VTSTSPPPGDATRPAPARPVAEPRAVQGRPVAEPRAMEARPREPIASEALFAGAREVQIAHRGSLYRLKQTALGKLILTK